MTRPYGSCSKIRLRTQTPNILLRNSARKALRLSLTTAWRSTSPLPAAFVFLSDKGTWNINTWALSKARYINAVQVGQFDTAEVGSGNTRYGPITGKPSEYLSDGKVLGSFGRDADLTYKEIMVKYATANYVSHYFTIGKTSVQVRTK